VAVEAAALRHKTSSQWSSRSACRECTKTMQTWNWTWLLSPLFTTLVCNVRYLYEVHVGCDTQSHLFLSGAVSTNISTAAMWGRFSRVFTWSHLSLFCVALNVVTTNVRSSRLPPPLAGWCRCCTARGVYGGFICERTQPPLHIRDEVREGAEPSPHQDGLIDWSREPANVIPGKRGFATGF